MLEQHEILNKGKCMAKDSKHVNASVLVHACTLYACI